MNCRHIVLGLLLGLCQACLGVVADTNVIALGEATNSQASVIAWGAAVDGVQIGLVSVGRGADGVLAWRDECPDCDCAGKPERRLWNSTCDTCGSKKECGAHCESCRAKLRLCYGCKKVRPTGSKFNVGDALAFEVQVRNIGEKDQTILNLPEDWAFRFQEKGGQTNLWNSSIPARVWKDSPPRMTIPSGGQRMCLWVFGKAGNPAGLYSPTDFVKMNQPADGPIAASELPAGEYVATVIHRPTRGGHEQISGPVTIQICQAAGDVSPDSIRNNPKADPAKGATNTDKTILQRLLPEQ